MTIPQSARRDLSRFRLALRDHSERANFYANWYKPMIGRIVPEFEQSHIRELIHPPFRIVYMLTPDALVVIRVWRSERLLKLP